MASETYLALVTRSFEGALSGACTTRVGGGAFRDCTGLTGAELPYATSVGSYAFYGCTGLPEIDLPTCASLGSYAFYGCTALARVDLAVCVSIGSNAFAGCTALDTLILRGGIVADLGGALTDTPIASGEGYVYVPSELVESYQAAYIWKNYPDQFRAIEDYPDVCG